MFLSREFDVKLCQNYTKTDICQILYKSCSIKQYKHTGLGISKMWLTIFGAMETPQHGIGPKKTETSPK